MKKKEIIFIIAVIVVAIGAFIGYRLLQDNTKEIGVIYFKDQAFLEFDVNVDETYELDGSYGHMYVEVKDGQWRVTREECPNHICSSIGWVSVKNYFPIVCFPNEVYVALKD